MDPEAAASFVVGIIIIATTMKQSVEFEGKQKELFYFGVSALESLWDHWVTCDV